MIFIDEPRPPWQRWFNLDSSWPVRQKAALHAREQWLLNNVGVMAGYRAQAHLLKSRWSPSGRTAPIHIIFNGAVKSQPTW